MCDFLCFKALNSHNYIYKHIYQTFHAKLAEIMKTVKFSNEFKHVVKER